MAHSAHITAEEVKEIYDSPEELDKKVDALCKLVQKSNKFVIFTGAGISTSAGIPDFRGPEGKWTRLAQGKQPRVGKSSLSAIPTKTHMSIIKLQEENICTYLISQNCDGLHRRSGIKPNKISELHGNGNIEHCETCGEEYLRDYHCTRLKKGRDHYTGRHCVAKSTKDPTKLCNGRLLNSTIDFGQNLPERPLELAYENSQSADIHLVLGSSLRVSPACDMPKITKKKGGKLVIVNLQKTPLDKYADIRIYGKCDDVMGRLMEKLNLSVPEFQLNRYFSIHFIYKGLNENNNEKWNCKITPFEYGTKGNKIPASTFEKIDFSLPFTAFKQDKLFYKWKFVLNNQLSSRKLQLSFNCRGNYSELPFNQTFELPTCNHNEIPIHSSLHYEFYLQYHPMNRIWNVVNVRSKKSSNWIDFPLKMNKSSFLPNNDLHCLSKRSMGTATTLNDKIIFMGGKDRFSDSKTDFISIYDLNKHEIVKKIQSDDDDCPFINQFRWGHSATRINSYQIITFGGWDSTCQYADLWRFDLHTEQLDSIVPSGEGPSSRSGHSAILLDKENQIFIFGGSCCKNGPYEFYSDSWLFDIDSYEWIQLQCNGDIPSPRSQHSIVSLDSDHLLLFGGYNGTHVLNDLYVFTISSFTWDKIDYFGDFPEISSVEQKNFRVYPARATLMETINDYFIYVGIQGTYSLKKMPSGKWFWDKISPFSSAAHSYSETKQGILLNGGSSSAEAQFELLQFYSH